VNRSSSAADEAPKRKKKKKKPTSTSSQRTSTMNEDAREVSYGNCLWSPYGIGQAIIFLPCGFFLSSFFLLFYSSPNLSGRRVDVYHTSTHGVALVRI